MNKIKKLFIFLCGFIIALYALFLLAPVIVSPIVNAKKDTISELIKESTGFNAELSGITVITSWNFSAGIKIKEFKLAVPDSDKPFFYAKDTGIKLSLLPVLHKKVQLDSLFSEAVFADIIVKKDGKLQLLDYLPEQKGKPKESFDMPYGLKLSNNLPSIFVKSYRLAVIDKKTDRSYFMEGEDFKVTNFVLDKRVKFSTKGKLVFDNNTVSNFDLKVDNRIMPDIQLHDLVFPQDVVLENEEAAAEEKPFELSLAPVIDIFEKIKSNKLAFDIVSDLKVEGVPKSPVINGHFKVDGLTVAVDGKPLPKSNLDMSFKGHNTSISSNFYTSSDIKEVTTISGTADTGHRKNIDLSVRSNAKFQHIIDLADSIASSFNINSLNTLAATGGIDADFNIKSDLKTVSSDGYLKVLPSSLSYGLYNVSINNIVADIDCKNNDINIKDAGFSIYGQPMRLSGKILSDSTADLTLIADKLSLKGLLVALGQSGLLKDNNINSGVLSLNAVLKGKLLEIKPKLDALVANVNIYNKPAAAQVILPSASAKISYDGKKASGNIDINSFSVSIPGAKIVVPKANVIADPDIIKIQNSYMMLNDSRIDVKGTVKDYLNDKMVIDISAAGGLQSAGIAAFLPKEFRSLISYKGQLPVKILINGNARVQNIVADLSADPNNYISLIDVKALKGQKTKIHSNIEVNGDTLTLTNTNLSNQKSELAMVSGNITKLYSSPNLHLNIAVPNAVSFPIWGIRNSNITAVGNVNVTGDIANPNMKGTVNVSDISIKDMDLVISNLVADLSGPIVNGSGTAKKFRFGGIVATDISGKFSLKDYTKFYLTDATANAFDGKVSGKISYDIPTTKTGVEFTGKGLDSSKAIEGAVGIKKALTGTMGFDGKLTMQGVTDKEIIQSLKGNLNFNIDDGRFVSIGKLENLVAAQNVVSNSILKAAISALSTLSTVQEADRFKSISGSMTFSNGTANLNKILVSGPVMSYYVKGTYNIIPNSANLVILGRLDTKVVSILGPLGQLSADKLLSYIPKFGAATANILKQLTSDPKNENTSLIPSLSGGSMLYKDFKVVYNGPVESASSVRSFKWLSTCDTSEMNLKQDLLDAQKAVLENVSNKITETQTKVENVQKNINSAVEAQKAKVEQTKKDIEQAKSDLKTIKESSKQSAENLKNLFRDALKNSGKKPGSSSESSATQSSAPAATSSGTSAAKSTSTSSTAESAVSQPATTTSTSAATSATTTQTKDTSAQAATTSATSTTSASSASSSSGDGSTDVQTQETSE